MPNALFNNSGVRFLLTDYSIPSIEEIKALVSVKTALRLSAEKLENRHRVNIAKSVVDLCLKTDNAKTLVISNIKIVIIKINIYLFYIIAG